MLNLLLSFFEGLIRNIGGGFGILIRRYYYRFRLGSIGQNVVISEGVFFDNPRDIFLGDNVWIDRYALLIAGAFRGDRQSFWKGVKEINAGELRIDNGVHIAPHSIIQAHGGVSIGKNVTIAGGARVYSLSHHYKNLNNPEDTNRYSFSSMAPLDKQFMIVGNVIIEDNAAIGLNAVILPGQLIPKGTWVGVLSNPTGVPLEANSVYSSNRNVK